ncbi:hypothetical protein [Flavobacterium rhizosphaerae]|uniref:Polymer-forming cytoskeletal protein n=1 Tax=Flavobacterium rhizosphaerae TaxID=3163298 RepID=A0ABW8YU15_9FLAO
MAIMCAALLFTSSMYDDINFYYSKRNSLYIENGFTANYAISNNNYTEGEPQYVPDLSSNYIIDDYGLFKIIKVNSFTKNDTVSAAYFAGVSQNKNLCLYLSDLDNGLTYSGNVKILGDKKLPSMEIQPKYIGNIQNNLESKGTITKSGRNLPMLTNGFEKIFAADYRLQVETSDNSEPVEAGQQFNNSFLSPVKYFTLKNSVLENTSYTGNLILYANDSIVIKKSAILEDVILIAPSIHFEAGFCGSVQAYATQKINVGENAILKYPSVLAVKSDNLGDNMITIQEGAIVKGAVVLFNAMPNVIENTITLNKGSIVYGEVYCQGRLFSRGAVYGAVFTQKFFYSENASRYENHIADTEINIFKRPAYFVPISIFQEKKHDYALVKKVW